ncbi:uncharacterized protein SETTUDRAFT_161957 [Exserohilum turcica Et28A]|uniref:Uncharacterized protein n=1 Tax=Exserohilum turcicum (strain 28A) TaxID=671987 RepID=R0IA57_EXST2|nr:uncharacterized protein SETTUDRAFT_161957 [Exserohilum turcica Et28A]EOA82355.1 hypothetical protein SETTUDRAFT_161957 [Exserohilum turcica Et28A]
MAQSMEAELEDKFWQLCWSFVTTAGNNLLDGLEWLLTRASSTEGGIRLQTSDGRWRIKKVHEYLRQMDRFLELLLGCVHIESGQPARGSEIVTMRHCNRLLQDRNIFIIDGTVMTDKPKVVPRFLPPRVGQIMALYLSYLQLFREFLVVSVLNGA